ncbi:MAG: DUF839 domain-containing protein [Planctomycetes bacterium]|nr:DUF839 domain-containing protein [Planctomycetota bacterium]
MRILMSLLFMLVCAAAQTPVVGELVISEVLPDAAVILDDNGEYFEVCNVSVRVLDLAGCSFIDTDSVSGASITGTLLLQPGEFMTFIRDAAQATAWSIPGQRVGYAAVSASSCSAGVACVAAGSMTFNNGADGVVIMNAVGTVLDSVAWSSATAGVALERVDLRSAWNAPGNVVAAVFPLDANNSGTPGRANSADETKAWLRSADSASGFVLATGAVPDIALLLGTTAKLHLLSPAHGGGVRILAASTGNSPGFSVGNIFIGLNQDELFLISLTPGNPYFVDFSGGAFDAYGADAASVLVPNVSALLGYEFYAAFVAADLSLGMLRESTVASLTLTAPAPLSSIVALSVDGAAVAAMGLPGITASSNAAELVKALIDATATNPALLAPSAANPLGISFPLSAATSETVRVIPGFTQSLVARWLDPLRTTAAVTDPRFGSNCDYLAWFGDGWDSTLGDPPQFHGSGSAGWLWANHEAVSGGAPWLTAAPTGAALNLAFWLRDSGLLVGNPLASVWSQQDVDMWSIAAKRQVGGSWLRAQQSGGVWSLQRDAAAVRYDASSATLLRITGYTQHALDHDDNGTTLPAGIAVGTLGNCSGGQSPWGTIFTGEENVQGYYGDLEACWSSNQRFITGAGFDPGANVSPNFASNTGGLFGRISMTAQHHEKDLYGFLSEIDPGVASDNAYDSVAAGGDGLGHRKLGSMGRARWENATFATDTDWKLISGQPIVIYAGDDRRSGRVFKFVSAANTSSGMTRGQIRALLDSGTLHVAHFQNLDHATGETLVGGGVPTEAAPANGVWYQLTTSNTGQIAPNAAALGVPTQSIGAALTDLTWNGIGGFADDNMLRACLFSVCNKLGISEMNRPEDVEWNPYGTPRLFIAFTGHGGRVANNESGVQYPPATHATLSPTRPDSTGSVVALQETNSSNPGASTTFTWFRVWKGSNASQNNSVVDPFRAASVDNLMIDNAGGVWFGTDGNLGNNGRAEALYHLDLDPAHQAGMPGVVNATYGKAFRVASLPSNAEATGPCFASDLRTIFISVQHPGAGVWSTWPNGGL